MASTILAPVRPCNLLTRLSKCKNLAVLKMGLSAAQTQTEEAAVKIRATRGKTSASLEQMSEYNLVEPGFKVLHIGEFKSAWSQSLIQGTNSSGKAKDKPVGVVISVSAGDVKGVVGVHNLPNMDFMQVATQDKIIQVLGRGRKFDLILSDWVPEPSGVRKYDNMRMAKMVFCVYLFLVKHLRQGGSCLLNVEGVQRNMHVRKSANELFKKVHLVHITKGTSSSAYLLATELCSESSARS